MSLFFSEAINHLRSAIENTLFYLVENPRGSTLPENHAKRVSLPIYQDEASFCKWLRDNDRKGLQELGAGSLLGGRVRTLQPFVDPERVLSISNELAQITGVTPVAEAPLALLQQYSNYDKHRIPVAAAGRSSVSEGVGSFVGSDHVMRPINIGDVLGTARLGEIGEIETNSAVHIRRPVSDIWVGPAGELDKIRTHVADYVIPTLVTGFALPSTLPPHIDLIKSYESERSRIEDGGWISGPGRATHDAFSAVLASLQAPPAVPRIVDVEE